MGENSEISWTDHTINLWWGCTKVSPGCANCYADTFSRRFGKDVWGPGKPREDHRKNAIKTALKLNRQAGADEISQNVILNDSKAGTRNREWAKEWHRPRVFSASMSDWLDDEVPIEWLADLLDLIRRTPNLDWLLLTKRPENWRKRVESALAFYSESIESVLTDDEADFMNWLAAWMRNDGIDPIPANVWIGTTVENQAMADKRIPLLLDIPAKVRFLSCEPLLEKVDLMWPESLFPDGPTRCCGGYQCGCHGEPAEPPMIYGIHWIIAGGESGPGFRPFDPDWARSLRDQCKAANVAFHMKQMSGLRPSSMPPIPQDLQIREFPTP